MNTLKKICESSIPHWIKNMPGGFLVYRADDSKEILYSNDWVWKFFDCDTEEAFLEFSKKDFSTLIYEEDAPNLLNLANIMHQAKVGQFSHVQYRVKTRLNQMKYVEDFGHLTVDPEYGEIVILMLVSPEASINIGSGSDPITGLLNSSPFLTSSSQLLSGTEQLEEYYLIYFNIRNFKLFNIKYNDGNGAWVLRNLADMLQMNFENCLISRYVGDHFVVLTNKANLEAMIEETCDMFSVAYNGEGMELKAGIYHIDEDYESVTTACNYAKIACDNVHDDIDHRYCYYDENINRSVKVMDHVIHDIDYAIENGHIKVYFQPIIRTLTGGLSSFEALARWDDPEFGLLSPVDFIPALEKSHQIYKLDVFMVTQTCRMLRERLNAGKHVVPVSFNISRIDLLACNIFDEIEQIIATYEIDRNLVRVEITESAMLGDTKIVVDTMQRFQDAGYQVWMDDFGNGYSSLNLFNKCGFDVMKLDMEFLARFNQKSKTIIENLVRMAKQIGVQTLAEGVETKEQYEFLRDIGCEKMQGFYFSKPVPSEQAIAYLEEYQETSETPELSTYYDLAGKVEAVTDKPLALIEYKEDVFEYLYVNELYIDVLLHAGRKDSDEIKHYLNSNDSDMASKFRDFVKSIPDDSQFKSFVYVVGTTIIRLTAKRVAQCSGREIYQAELSNINPH